MNVSYLPSYPIQDSFYLGKLLGLVKKICDLYRHSTIKKYFNGLQNSEQIFYYDCTVKVKDLEKAMESVKTNGGTITKEKMEIPGVGFFAGAKDTEGNKFGLMQATDWKPEG